MEIIKLSQESLQQYIQRITNAVERGTIAQNPELDSILGELTAGQMNQFIENAPEDVSDKVFMYLWNHQISWGFETSWALALSMGNELEKMTHDEREAIAPPDDFDPNVPLGGITKWAPHDLKVAP